jgi:hypothetical protein
MRSASPEICQSKLKYESIHFVSKKLFFFLIILQHNGRIDLCNLSGCKFSRNIKHLQFGGETSEVSALILNMFPKNLYLLVA